MFRLIVFVSGGGTNLQNIIDAIHAGYLSNVSIACVLESSKGTRAGLRAKEHGIDVVSCSRKDFSDQESFDQALLEIVKPYKPDLIVLAGYLSRLGPDFINAYPYRIINIHPSLLPAFGGQGYYGIKPHQAALAAGVKETGATVHYVDSDYDTGEILMQKTVPIKAGDTAELLQKRVMQEAERVILPDVIRLLAEQHKQKE